MKIMFFAFIRDYTKCKDVELQYCATVEDMLKCLCCKYGENFEKRVFNEGVLSDEIIILVNGRHINHLNGINTCLSSDDTISIFPVVAGG